MPTKSVVPAALLAVCAGVACDAARRTEMAHGTEASIIVLAADSLWAEVADTVLSTLEPRVFTVRDEKMFEATHASPLTGDWLKLRVFRQVLTIGDAGDGWVAPALERGGVPAPLPALVETEDVWSRGQTVTALVLPPDEPGAAVRELLPALMERLDARFRAYARNRMYLSELNAALQDTLRASSGFALALPRIYTADRVDSTWVFRNRAEVGGELIRTLVVTWRPGLVALDAEAVVAWRDAIAPSVYEPQVTERDRLETRPVPGAAAGSLEVQGIWRSADPSFPAAGPFIDRVVPCPGQDRTYFLEGWLYAPGRPKYEYMIQMETLLDSFECGPFDG